MGFASNEQFLACHDCGRLYPLVSPAPNEETACGDEDDLGEFLSAHGCHDLAYLRRNGTETSSDRPLWDPLAALMFEVTDGEGTYIATASRLSIDAPRIYTFIPGALAITASEIAVDDRDLRRALDMEFHPHALRPTKMDRFVSVVREVVSHIDPNGLDIAFDAADDPATSIARMPDEQYEELLQQCAQIFDAWELPRVSDFLQHNRNEDGLLALRIRRQTNILTA